VRTWIRLADGHDWIIYSTSTTDDWKLWKIPVSSEGVVKRERMLLASGTGKLGSGGAASLDGKLTWYIWHLNHSIYQLNMSRSGQRLDPTLQLLLAQGGSQSSPSLSHDGKWLAYDSAEAAKPNAIVLRNLISGVNQVLDEKGRNSPDGADVSISPDGTKVVFTRDCEPGRQWSNRIAYPCSFLLATDKSMVEPVCSQCTPRGFAPDGSSILVQKYPGTDIHKFRIDSIDLRTKAEREFLSDPENPLFHAFFSWDGRWVVFKKLWLTVPGMTGQIFIVPVRQGVAGPKSEWIAITDGKHEDDKPQFSSDGNTLYFTSSRDGYLCIWAQRLNPVTKRPLGQPFAYEHFHNASGRSAPVYSPSLYDLSVAGDKMVINLPQVLSDVWMTDVIAERGLIAFRHP
jgi:Tol biopolymer transport system component